MEDAMEAPGEEEMGREELALWTALRARDDQDARRILIERYVPLVRMLASAIYRSSNFGYVELQDLIQLGTVGLLQAIASFDTERGSNFGLFAKKRIRGAILNGLDEISELHAQSAFRRRIKRDRLESLREGAAQAKESDVFLQMVDVAVGLAVGRMLEDTSMYVDPDGTAPSHREPGQLTLISDSFRRIVERLTETQQRVVNHHYVHGLQFVEIAKLLGVSKGRISQIHADAMAELRHIYRSFGALDLKI